MEFIMKKRTFFPKALLVATAISLCVPTLNYGMQQQPAGHPMFDQMAQSFANAFSQLLAQNSLVIAQAFDGAMQAAGQNFANAFAILLSKMQHKERSMVFLVPLIKIWVTMVKDPKSSLTSLHK